jgi:hypothetical protein
VKINFENALFALTTHGQCKQLEMKGYLHRPGGSIMRIKYDRRVVKKHILQAVGAIFSASKRTKNQKYAPAALSPLLRFAPPLN